MRSVPVFAIVALLTAMPAGAQTPPHPTFKKGELWPVTKNWKPKPDGDG
jgi:hypothetical protein